jgi:2-methylisocitrate lyase-like PEP mutase family enzyme
MDVRNSIRAFADLHQPGNPLVLVNIWDAGSARAVAKAGAKAIATSSWSVAAAAGLEDGQALPIDALIGTAHSVANAVEVPVTVDFEGGYAVEPERLRDNVARLLEAPIAGCNFEDGIVGGTGMHPIADQAARVRAVVEAAASHGRSLFVNARTDLFLSSDPATHAHLVDEALQRAAAYADAGASGFFVPGLSDPGLIQRICRLSPLPVNVMVLDPGADLAALAALGVARISFGPAPYFVAMQALTDLAAGLIRQ